ncbi:MAG: hypothetical protein ACMUIA_06660 [bacterium]
MFSKSTPLDSTWKNIILGMIVFIALGLITSSIAHGQYWQAMPPYNTLWPLWSPTLSPIDATTGLPTPIVTSLSRDTVLPVQPGLTWNPYRATPWLLYNTPVGLAYYDPLIGVGLWPHLSLLVPKIGLPLTLTLPSGYSSLAPTDSAWISSAVPWANQVYSAIYPYLQSLTPPPTGFTLPPLILYPAPLPPAPLPANPVFPLPAGISPTTGGVPVLLTPTNILGL